MRRFWAGMAGWFGRESEIRRVAGHRRQAVRPTLEACEGRLLLSRAGAIAQAPGRGAGRQVLVGAELNGMVVVTPQSPTVFRVTSSGAGRGTASLGQFTFETNDLTTFTSPTTTDIAQGSLTVTTARGARLTGTYTGRDDVIASRQVFLDEFHFTITGGTGRFRGATGSLTGRGIFNNGPATPTLPANGVDILLFGTLTLRRTRG
jgi:hypothetical protein